VPDTAPVPLLLLTQVLIFCTMTIVLDVIEELLEWRGLSGGVLRLDGSTSASERGELVSRFNDPGSGAWVFLLSLRAGGVGEASHAVIPICLRLHGTELT
jgi:SNF2 family DNA or RNA helicase